MFGIKRDWAAEIVTLLIAILFFQSIPRLQFIGKYFEQYPYIILGVAFALLVFRKKIIDFISK